MAVRWEQWFSRCAPTRSTARGVAGSLLATVAIHEIWHHGFGFTGEQLLWEGALVAAVLLLTDRRRSA